MAVLSSSRKKWLSATLALVGLGFAGFLLWPRVTNWLEGRRICQQLTDASKDPGLRLFYFTHTRNHPSQSQLDPGSYRLTLTSDCYEAQCTFEELDLPDLVPNLTLPATDPCRGQPLVLWSRDGSVGGFSAPSVLEPRRMIVRIEQNGRVLWAGTPGQSCSERGFCVEAYPPE